MHQHYTTTICIEVITCPCLVSYQCGLPLLIWIIHLLALYYSTNQSKTPKSSRKPLNHSHTNYTSLFFSFFFFFLFLFFFNTYGLYHNINIKLIINDRKFVVLMVKNKLFFLLLMTIFFIEWFFQDHMRVLYITYIVVQITPTLEKIWLMKLLIIKSKLWLNIMFIITNFYN